MPLPGKGLGATVREARAKKEAPEASFAFKQDFAIASDG